MNFNPNFKSIYFGGFDVFKPDCLTIRNNIEEMCQKYGFNMLFPFDLDVTTPKEIYERNIVLLNKADYMLANINDFRGTEPDSGTVWEFGYCIAKNIPVIAYMSDHREKKQKVTQYFYLNDKIHQPLMPDGMYVEDFGFETNLMLQLSAKKIVHGGVSKAFAYLVSEYNYADLLERIRSK